MIKAHLIPCTSCKTSYNVLRQFVGVGVGVGVLVLLTFGGGGVVQNRESPDFRSPEVGRYDRVLEPLLCYTLYRCVHIDLATGM